MSDRNRVQRRLAAILAADVVGYSRLMEGAEAATLTRLRALRSELLEPAIDAHGGRIFKTTGDGLLAEFASAVGCLECAIEIQGRLSAREADQPPENRMLMRIGISLGDVFIEGTDILGNGVNVAARMESLAEPGGICISANVHEHVAKAVSIGFEDLGEQQVKNISQPIRTWRVCLTPRDGERTAATGGESQALTANGSDTRPAIAVLPFDNMSGDPDQEYFADGMVEEIITGLSQIRWLTVIARNSSFAFRQKSTDIREVAARLKVRYVLAGGVRKAGERVRITAQLIEAEGGGHLWAERFDGTLADVFDLQDQITIGVVAAIEPSLRRAETERAKRKRPNDLTAYDLYLRALEQAYRFSPEGRAAANALLDRALEHDPAYAEAHGLAAWCRQQRYLWGGRRQEDREAAIKHAKAAASLGTDDATTLAFAGFVISALTGDHHTSEPMFDRALAQNPNSAITHSVKAIFDMRRGRPADGLGHAELSLRLSPFDPLRYLPETAIACARLLASDPAAALTHGRRALEANPKFAPALIIVTLCMVRLGQLDGARSNVRRLVEVAPDTRISNLHERFLMADTLGFDTIAAEMRLAGLPE